MSINIWIEKTLVKNRKDRTEGDRAMGKALWSPKTGIDGRNTYKNMLLVKAGDSILHLVDNSSIVGISLVDNNAQETDGLPGTQWNTPSYLIKLKNYTTLLKPVERDILLNKKNKSKLNSIAQNSEVFYNSDLNLRQGGYLTPCPTELLTIINECYNLTVHKNLPFIDELGLTLKQNEMVNDIIKSNFRIKIFLQDIETAGLIFSTLLIQRFIASLCSKPFVICSGLSGSGKTKLAQSFVQWISESEQQYKIIPVGADWTNREPLLGYPNGLDFTSYVNPDSCALQLIIEASKEENQRKPYFLILDEMNLSHVERYFADFLSIMESGDSIKLYSGAERKDSNGIKVPQEITWPKNLFIIGTVNIDETTYMFSPKVLDRANVIEFRITPTEMRDFFKDRIDFDLKELYLDKDETKGGAGQSMGESFLKIAVDRTITKVSEDEENVLNNFFAELQVVGSEFGYRTASEIQLLISKLGMAGFVDNDNSPLEHNTKIDIAIMQKLLPKLHGSRKKLVGPLETLAGFCVVRLEGSKQDEQHKSKSNYQQFIAEKRNTSHWKIKYPISLEKIERMHKNVIENGFTSYAEA